MRFVPLPRLSICAASALVCLFSTAWLSAAEPSASEISVARRLFEEGAAFEADGKWLPAAEKFRKAAAIKDTPGLRFHLARCEEERGALVEALIEYDRARELLAAGAKAPDVEKLLGAARQRVQDRVALVTLRLPEGASDATVQIDGKPLSSSVIGLPLPLNPGVHQVMVSAPGRRTYADEVRLSVGESRELRPELPAEAPSPPARPAAAPMKKQPAPALSGSSPDAGGPSGRTIALGSEAGLFALGLGTGVVFTVLHGSAQARFERANGRVLASVGGDDGSTACSPPEPAPGCGELNAARDDRRQAAVFATAGFVAAGVSAAAFGLTWWLWPRASDGRVAVSAAPEPGGFGLRVAGKL